MSRTLPLVLLALIVAGCGVQRPLMRPRDIPAFEQQQREKQEKIEQERIEAEKEAAARKAASTPATQVPTSTGTNTAPTEPAQ